MPSRYAWALLVGPKEDAIDPSLAVQGRRIQVVEDPYNARWQLEGLMQNNIRNTGPDMLVRVLVGKIVDKPRFGAAVYATPVGEDDPAYRNMWWVFEALERLREGGGVREGVVGEGARLEWMQVAMVVKSLYEKRAAAGIFDKKYDANTPKPAFDLIKERWIFEG